MNITIRLETPTDYRTVEELTREAFWGCMDHPTCDGEHLIVHKLRSSSAFVPELDFVAETEGQLVGNIIYSKSKIIAGDGRETEVLTFGPLSVLPAYKKMGIGSALLRCSIARAKELGYRAIIIYGHPDYYPRFGFRRAGEYGITTPQGTSFDALMALELYDGALDGISGKFYEDKVFEIAPEEIEEFDKRFPPKDPVQLLPLDVLKNKLPESVFHALSSHKIKYIASLQKYSGAELLSWEGIDKTGFERLNHCLKELGFAEKLSSCYIAVSDSHKQG